MTHGVTTPRFRLQTKTQLRGARVDRRTKSLLNHSWRLVAGISFAALLVRNFARPTASTELPLVFRLLSAPHLNRGLKANCTGKKYAGSVSCVQKFQRDTLAEAFLNRTLMHWYCCGSLAARVLDFFGCRIVSFAVDQVDIRFRPRRRHYSLCAAISNPCQLSHFSLDALRRLAEWYS